MRATHSSFAPSRSPEEAMPNSDIAERLVIGDGAAGMELMALIY
jgi:hypothetical protein